MADVVKTNDTIEEFRTNGHTLDEATFYEVKRYIFPVFKQKAIITVCIIAIIAGLFLFLGLDKLIIGILLVVFGVVFLLDAFAAKGRAVRKSVKQIRQITGKDFCTYNYTLNDQDLFVRCVETNMNEHIPYEKLVRRTETNNTIVLFTKESRMIIFRKNKLSEKEKQQFIEFVDAKCPQMTYVEHK